MSFLIAGCARLIPKRLTKPGPQTRTGSRRFCGAPSFETCWPERSGGNLIALDTAIEIVEKAEMQFAGGEFPVSSRAVMRLVVNSRCSAYDCEFIALARDQSVPLLTVDRQLLRDFPKTAI